VAGESPFGFERPYPEVLAELTDQEVTMLAVGMLLLLAMKDAAIDQVPEERYDLTLAKLANEMYTRAMRRF
jgi:hypothetical protein